jgi:hypothetical protein
MCTVGEKRGRLARESDDRIWERRDQGMFSRRMRRSEGGKEVKGFVRFGSEV